MKDRIELLQGDITTVKVDAIVNAATTHCLGVEASMAPSTGLQDPTA